MNAKNGNITLVRKTVSSYSSILKNRTKNGVARIPATTIIVTVNVRKVKKHDKNSRVFSRLFSSKYPLNVGINATEIEPSANSRRNKFGSMNATEKASARAEVPRKLALVISLSSPRILDINVRSESLELWRIREPVD